MKEHIDILVLSSRGHKRHVERLSARRPLRVRTGHRVQMTGERDTFMVLRVDARRHLADLLRDGAVRKVEAGIPISLLQVVSEPRKNEPRKGDRQKKEPGELDSLQMSA